MTTPPPRIEIIGLSGLPEIGTGVDLAGTILDACRKHGFAFLDGDVVVVTQKVVSKAEGRVTTLASVEPSPLARIFAETWRKDPRAVELSLSEARRIVRMDRGVLITETTQGFVCANSGVDTSNVPGEETASLLPRDPDGSARALRARLEQHTQKRLAVIVSDTFGRPWREGVTNVAIGASGIDAVVDYRGERDHGGRPLASTVIAHVDELAAAAELVMGKLDRVPIAVVRGYAFTSAGGGVQSMLRRSENDLFR